MNRLLSITASPHLRSQTTTQNIMADVLIALVPSVIAAILFFGYRSLVLAAVCVTTSVLCEYGYRKLMHLSNTIPDLSAAVTGLLLAFNLPVTVPLWMAMIGCFVAVVIVKQLFGGLGKNFANPAIVGRIVLMVSFSIPMTSWVVPGGLPGVFRTADAVTGATPLAASGTGDYLQLFLGQIGGSMGETCKLALLLGGGYLVVRRVITLSATVSFMGTVVVVAAILGQDPLYQLLAGGVILGAVFMATDYVTTPTTERGKILFGVGCGILTMVIRTFSSYPEGVSFAILLMNILTPHIDTLTRIRPLGGAKA